MQKNQSVRMFQYRIFSSRYESPVQNIRPRGTFQYTMFRQYKICMVVKNILVQNIQSIRIFQYNTFSQ